MSTWIPKNQAAVLTWYNFSEHNLVQYHRAYNEFKDSADKTVSSFYFWSNQIDDAMKAAIIADMANRTVEFVSRWILSPEDLAISLKEAQDKARTQVATLLNDGDSTLNQISDALDEIFEFGGEDSDNNTDGGE